MKIIKIQINSTNSKLKNTAKLPKSLAFFDKLFFSEPNLSTNISIQVFKISVIKTKNKGSISNTLSILFLPINIAVGNSIKKSINSILNASSDLIILLYPSQEYFNVLSILFFIKPIF